MSSAADPNAAQREAQSVGLKVMRLSKPSFRPLATVVCEPWDLAASTLPQPDPSTATHRGASPYDNAFCLSEQLMLPTSFGSIYVGEEFVSYISIFNSSNAPITALSIKAELQTTSNKRWPLLEFDTEPGARFGPGNSHDVVVRQEVTEEGAHMLICSATYTKHDGEKKSMRKFYKFMVETPFSIAHTVRAISDNELAVESRVRNQSKATLLLDNVHFRPADPNLFSITDLNDGVLDCAEASLTSKLAASSNSSKFNLMKPGQIRNYLYKLVPASAAVIDQAQLATNLGCIEVAWRSNFGAAGVLLSQPVERAMQLQREIEIQFLGVPQELVVETPCDVQCEITNKSSRTLHLRFFVALDCMGGVMVSGVFSRALTPLAPQAKALVPLTLFPLRAGVQQITGLRVVDQQQAITHDFDNVMAVFVVGNEQQRRERLAQ